MASELTLAKTVNADERRFVDRLLEQQSQREVMLAWFGKDTNASSLFADKPKQLLLLLTEFRIMTFRKSFIGRKLKDSFRIIDIIELSVAARGRGQYVTLITYRRGIDASKRMNVVAHLDLSRELVHSLLCARALLHHGKPVQEQPPFYLPPEIEFGFRAPPLGPRCLNAIVHMYRAISDLLHTLPRQRLLDYIHRVCNSDGDDEVFDPISELSGDARPDFDAVHALALAVRNTNTFSGVRASNFPALGCQGVEALLHAIGPNSPYKRIELSDVGMCGRSSVTLGSSLASLGAFGTVAPVLHTLVLHKCVLHDSSVRSIVLGLNTCKARLKVLKLSFCALSKTSVVAICTDLLCKAPLRDSVELLDLSGAICGQSGSNAVANALACATALQHFIAVQAHLQTRPVLSALQTNKELVVDKLKAINLSQNKVGRRAAVSLAAIVQRARRLRDVVVSDARLNDDGVNALLTASMNNEFGGAFRLDLSFNELNAASMLALLRQRPKQEERSHIEALDVSDAHLNLEQMARAVECMSLLPALHTLSISNNAKTGLWRRGDDLGEQLVMLLTHSTSLRRLYIRGENGTSSLGSVLMPLIEALAHNQMLQTLSLRGNSLPTKALKALAHALTLNRTLKALDIDANNISWDLMKQIAAAVCANESLCFLFVESDLRRLRRKHAADADNLFDSVRQRLEQNAVRQNVQRDDVWPVQPIASPVQHRTLSTPLKASKKNSLASLFARSYSGRRSQAPGGVLQRPQFGCSLSECDSVFVPLYNARIPRVLVLMHRFLLSSNAFSSEGLFRVAPDTDEARRVKAELENGSFSHCQDVNCVSAALKAFMRELQPPLLNEVALRVLSECPEAPAERLDEILQALPPSANAVFLWLCDLCVYVSAFEADNKMSSKNLAIVFAPNLFQATTGPDPLASIRQSRDVAKLMEAAIESRRSLDRRHPTLAELNELLLSAQENDSGGGGGGGVGELGDTFSTSRRPWMSENSNSTTDTRDLDYGSAISFESSTRSSTSIAQDATLEQRRSSITSSAPPATTAVKDQQLLLPGAVPINKPLPKTPSSTPIDRAEPDAAAEIDGDDDQNQRPVQLARAPLSDTSVLLAQRKQQQQQDGAEQRSTSPGTKIQSLSTQLHAELERELAGRVTQRRKQYQ